MNTIILIIIVSLLNIVCFFLGARIGQKVAHDEPIKAPNPIKAIEERKDSRENKEEQEKNNTILENINNYDGTGIGQRDIY